MSFFGGTPQTGPTALEQLIGEIGEEIDARALVQYVTDDRRRDLWALLLLTPTTIHVIYGRGQNWFARLTTQAQAEQHDLAIALDTISGIEIPQRGGFFRRILTGPTRLAVIHRRGDEPIRLEVDDSAAEILQQAQERIP